MFGHPSSGFVYFEVANDAVQLHMYVNEDRMIAVGRMRSPQGHRFEGRFRTAQGKFSLIKGRKFFPDGEFQEGDFEGANMTQGTKHYKQQGVTLQGTYVHDYLSEGTQTLSDGTTMHGKFGKGGVFEQGTLTLAKNNLIVRLDGTFLPNGRLSKGTVVFVGGHSINGQWREGFDHLGVLRSG
jgi:hypothetical protein